jgi:hypothetical protein
VRRGSELVVLAFLWPLTIVLEGEEVALRFEAAFFGGILVLIEEATAQRDDLLGLKVFEIVLDMTGRTDRNIENVYKRESVKKALS